MCRGLLVLVVLCALAHAQGGQNRTKKETEEQKQIQRIRDLARELRELASRSPTGTARANDQKPILAEIAKINHPQAVRTLAAIVEDPAYLTAREDILRILADMPGADEAIVTRVMHPHIVPGDPARQIACDYLLRQAIRRRKDEWPHELYKVGTAEDKFLALQVLGRIESEHTLECAGQLAQDKSWSPDPTGLQSCGTIAASLERFEGPAAARLLLLLARDPRFTLADGAKVREATRTWHQADLRAYVNIAELSNRDPQTRQEIATFFGAVGHEAARAPLVRVAFNKSELPEVRAAAATALGGLRIAREDLVERLHELLSDPEPLVRAGAAAGLGRLNVIQAMEALVSMLDGPFAAEAAAALGRITNKPVETDWRMWLRMARSGGK